MRIAIRHKDIREDEAPYFIYYLFAKEFGWTPKEVDELDLITLKALLIIIDEVNRGRG